MSENKCEYCGELHPSCPAPQYDSTKYAEWECYLADYFLWRNQVHPEILDDRGRVRQRKMWQLNRYGKDTPEWYEKVYSEQGGACAICKSVPEEELFVDHCHTTGLKRALLCRQCNCGLGMFQDDVETLRAAIEYLEAHREQ